MKKSILGYTAGIIDGEGHIHIAYESYATTRKRKLHRCRVVVVNTKYELMNWLLEHWGGKAYARKRYSEAAVTSYAWMLHDQHAANFLECILPYLVLKKKQANLLIQLRATIGIQGRHIVDKSIIEERAKITAELRELNRKGGT